MQLSEDDRTAFQSATDIMQKMQMMDVENAQRSVSRTLGGRVLKTLNFISMFLKSVEICIQHNPAISALVVGGFHCALSVSLCSNLDILVNNSHVRTIACAELLRVLRKTYNNHGANSWAPALFGALWLEQVSKLTGGSNCAQHLF